VEVVETDSDTEVTLGMVQEVISRHLVMAR